MNELRTVTVVCVLLAGCQPVLRTRTVASMQAAHDMECRVTNVEAIDEWSFRADSACGEVGFYRCSGWLDQHCHAHASAAQVTGLFHAADGPAHPRH